MVTVKDINNEIGLPSNKKKKWMTDEILSDNSENDL